MAHANTPLYTIDPSGQDDERLHKYKVAQNIADLYAGNFGASGTFTANGTSAVTVANTAVTANSAIIVTLKTVGGTVGAIPAVKTITAGTGFTIAGTASDTSVYNYLILG